MPSIYLPVTPRSLLERFEAKFVKTDGCWLWLGAIGHGERGGYGRFSYEGRNVQAQRVAWLLYKGPIPDGLHVLHDCDVRPCVNPGHLWLGTNLDNILDKAKKHRGGVTGENNIHSRLSADQVRDILAAENISAIELAAKHGVHRSSIYALRGGKSWRHLRSINLENRP